METLRIRERPSILRSHILVTFQLPPYSPRVIPLHSRSTYPLELQIILESFQHIFHEILVTYQAMILQCRFEREISFVVLSQENENIVQITTSGPIILSISSNG